MTFWVFLSQCSNKFRLSRTRCVKPRPVGSLRHKSEILATSCYCQAGTAPDTSWSASTGHGCNGWRRNVQALVSGGWDALRWHGTGSSRPDTARNQTASPQPFAPEAPAVRFPLMKGCDLDRWPADAACYTFQPWQFKWSTRVHALVKALAAVCSKAMSCSSDRGFCSFLALGSAFG